MNTPQHMAALHTVYNTQQDPWMQDKGMSSLSHSLWFHCTRWTWRSTRRHIKWNTSRFGVISVSSLSSSVFDCSRMNAWHDTRRVRLASVKKLLYLSSQSIRQSRVSAQCPSEWYTPGGGGGDRWDLSCWWWWWSTLIDNATVHEYHKKTTRKWQMLTLKQTELDEIFTLLTNKKEQHYLFTYFISFVLT